MGSEISVNSDIAKVLAELPQGAVILAAVATSQRSDTPRQDITDALYRSHALCDELLAVVNGGTYRGEEVVETVDGAVARLGHHEVLRLIGALAWRQYCQPFGLYGVGPDELWCSGMFTGLLMAQLAPAAEVDGRIAFMAGLLRSVGKVVLSELARRTAEIPPYTEGDETLPQWEENMLGYTNTDVAAAALEVWRFPLEIATAVRCHYAPDENTSVLARMLNIAAGAADLRGHGFRGEEEYWRRTPQLLASCHLDRDSLAAAEAIAATEFQRIRSGLGLSAPV